MVARVFMDAPISVDNKTTTTTFQYKGISNIVIPSLPQIPARNDSAFTLSLNEKFRSLNSYQYLALVPHKATRKERNSTTGKESNRPRFDLQVHDDEDEDNVEKTAMSVDLHVQRQQRGGEDDGWLRASS
ncbi:Laccase [Arachis hypogaea]|nr:Laccase [Arachis hypogaea]